MRGRRHSLSDNSNKNWTKEDSFQSATQLLLRFGHCQNFFIEENVPFKYNGSLKAMKLITQLQVTNLVNRLL